MIELEYQNTEEEWLELSMYLNHSNEQYQKRIKLARIICILGFLYFVVRDSYIIITNYINGYRDFGVMLILLVISIILTIISFFYSDTIVDKFNRYSIKKDIKKMDDIFNKNIKVILNEETLTIITVKGNTNVHLSAIEDVQIIKDCICIIFKGRSSLMIPKEAFKDKEDKINFEETVRGYSK